MNDEGALSIIFDDMETIGKIAMEFVTELMAVHIGPIAPHTYTEPCLAGIFEEGGELKFQGAHDVIYESDSRVFRYKATHLLVTRR